MLRAIDELKAEHLREAEKLREQLEDTGFRVESSMVEDIKNMYVKVLRFRGLSWVDDYCLGTSLDFGEVGFV